MARARARLAIVAGRPGPARRLLVRDYVACVRSLSETWHAASARRSARTRGAARWALRVTIGLGALLVALVVLAAATIAYLTVTASGRRVLADRIEDALSGQIPGALAITSLDDIGADQAVLRGLRFSHPDGSPVLLVDEARIDLHLAELLGGTIGFEHARVTGGHLIIAVQPDGRTGLEAAFSEADGGSGRDKAKLQMRSIHVQDLTLTIQPSPDDTLVMRDVQGFVAIMQDDAFPGVRVRLDRISGKLAKPQFLGANLDILRADGWVHGAVEHVLDLKVAGELDGDRVDAHLEYFDREEKSVQLALDPKEGVRPHLAAFGAQLGTAFNDAIEVRVK
jgi:hypothetical protein